MIILSNALAGISDEGCLKVASSLAKRIKKTNENVHVITFDRESDLSDLHLQLNKLLFNRSLRKNIKSRKEKVLYLPFPARPIATMLRLFMLSLSARRYGLDVVLTQRTHMSVFSKMLLRLSGARVVVLSASSAEFYRKLVGSKKVVYLKTGVDTNQFTPVDHERAQVLKRKYGFDPNKKLILHVGHLNRGRNVGELTKIDPAYQVLLVTSTLTKGEQDAELKKELLSHPHIRLIDSYLPNIEEIYQMADLYFFPVLEEGHCIDVPLSCLEAAACNTPVLTTDFGEMKELIQRDGFYQICSFDSNDLNQQISDILNADCIPLREVAMEYDWEQALGHFFQK